MKVCFVLSASVRVQPQPHEAESVLVNVAGKLLLFQRDRSGPQIKDEAKDRPVRTAIYIFRRWDDVFLQRAMSLYILVYFL